MVPGLFSAASSLATTTPITHHAPPGIFTRIFPTSPKVVAGKEEWQEMHVCFFSLRDIGEGEELFYSYPTPQKVDLGELTAPDCACRAPGCYGRISKSEDQL